eukprot:870192_1
MSVMLDFLFTITSCIFTWTNFGYVLALALSIGFGLLWYGPVMGEVWAEAQGIDSESRAARRKEFKNSQIATVAMYCIMVLVVSYLSDQTKCVTINDALWLGALLWLGFALPLAVVQHSYNPNAKKVVLLVDLSYQLIYFLLQALCIVYFKNLTWDLLANFGGNGNGNGLGDVVADINGNGNGD